MENLSLQDLIILSGAISQYKKAYGPATERVKRLEKKIHKAILKSDVISNPLETLPGFMGTENAPLK